VYHACVTGHTLAVGGGTSSLVTPSKFWHTMKVSSCPAACCLSDMSQQHCKLSTQISDIYILVSVERRCWCRAYVAPSQHTYM
jgi:hypothetical protein